MKILFKIVLFRIFYFFFNPVRKIYWCIFKPHTRGVKNLIKNGDDLLLIRNSYGLKLWSVPGGRMRRGEDPEKAVCRETLEEVGIEIKNPIFIGDYHTKNECKNNTVSCYFSEVANKNFKIDPIEIKEACWLPKERLIDLKPQSHALSKIMIMYENHVRK